MRSWLLLRGVLCLVLLVGCDGVLSDYAGTLCEPDGTCVEGYHCVADTGRCALGPPTCANITTCAAGDGCCPQGCYADSDTDCTPECGNTRLEPGEGCDDGNTLDADDCPSTCEPNVCGDTFVDQQEPRLEACDDGNTVTENECAYGSPTCTLCNATCTEAVSLTGRYCGDGLRNDASEACDDGNANNEDDCLETCQVSACGDGHVDRAGSSTEACDDGNAVSETECAYGQASCTSCNSDCSGTLLLTGPFCGDGMRNGPGEVCDDGNTTTEAECPYGTASCLRCDASCENELALTGPHCGDRRVTHAEVCDDGNADACGTCSLTCTQTQLSKATGIITAAAGSKLNDKDKFTITDGINGTTVTFEFDYFGSGVATGNVQVEFTDSDTAAQIANFIATAINTKVTVPFEITAVASGHLVTVTHQREGSYGNRAMSEAVNSTLEFRVDGMSGGGGYDCPSGTRCARNEDCDPSLECLPDGTCGAP